MVEQMTGYSKPVVFYKYQSFDTENIIYIIWH